MLMAEIVFQIQYAQTSRDPGDLVSVAAGEKTRVDPHVENSRCFLRVVDAPYTLEQLQGVGVHWLVADGEDFIVQARSRFTLLLSGKLPDKIPGFKNNRTYSTNWATLRPFIFDKSTGLIATDSALGFA